MKHSKSIDCSTKNEKIDLEIDFQRSISLFDFLRTHRFINLAIINESNGVNTFLFELEKVNEVKFY